MSHTATIPTKCSDQYFQIEAWLDSLIEVFVFLLEPETSLSDKELQNCTIKWHLDTF